MVKNRFGLRGVSLHTGCALMACGMAAVPGWAKQAVPSAVPTPVPPREQRSSLLEQMQDEVAFIASEARSGIVTIEDARAVVVNYPESPLRKTNLQEQIKHLELDRKAAQNASAQVQTLFDAGKITKLELDNSRRNLAKVEARLAALHHALENTDQNDPLTERRQEMDERIAELEIDQKFLSEQEKTIQQEVNAGIARKEDLIEAREELAHTVQALTAMRRQKQEQTRNDYAAQLGSQARMYFLLAKGGVPKSGSGFSIGDGYILTTADVVQGMSNPIVTTDDGRRARATLVAVDGELNIGLLRLPSELTIPALKLGDSARVAPGHFAISIGNQAGQMNSVSLSLISGTRTQGIASSRHFYPDLLQIDGAMGGGISGAPVLSARGEVIGMWAAALNTEVAASLTNGLFDSQVKTALEKSSATEISLESSPESGKIEPFAPLFSPQGIGQAMVLDPNDQSKSTASASPQPPAKNALLSVPTYDKTGKRTSNPTGDQSSNEGRTAPRQTQHKVGQSNPAFFVSPSQNGETSGGKPNGGTFFGMPAGFVMNPFANVPAPSATSGFAIPVNAFKGLIGKLKMGKNIVHVWLGMDLEDVDNAHEANGFVRLDRQVKVRGIYANSPAAKSGGIKIGDILVSLSDTPVHTANEVRSTVLLRFNSGQKIDVNVRRAGKTMNVPLTLETRPANTPAILSTTAPLNRDTVRPK